MKTKFKHAYMETAKIWKELSYSNKLKVGAIIVAEHAILVGYNGTPANWDNDPEFKLYQSSGATYSDWPHEDEYGKYRLKTKSETIHAEMNALAKLAKSRLSGENAILFSTTAPCLTCSTALYNSGIKEVYYENEYKNSDGILFLKKCNILVEKLGG